MSNKIIAFWEYDLYPYTLAGTVESFYNPRMAQIKEYSRKFKYFALLPEKEGNELKNHLHALRVEKKIKEKELSKEYREKLCNVLNNYNISHPKKQLLEK